jgi:hypothetical protein
MKGWWRFDRGGRVRCSVGFFDRSVVLLQGVGGGWIVGGMGGGCVGCFCCDLRFPPISLDPVRAGEESRDKIGRLCMVDVLRLAFVWFPEGLGRIHDRDEFVQLNGDMSDLSAVLTRGGLSLLLLPSSRAGRCFSILDSFSREWLVFLIYV